MGAEEAPTPKEHTQSGAFFKVSVVVEPEIHTRRAFADAVRFGTSHESAAGQVNRQEYSINVHKKCLNRTKDV